MGRHAGAALKIEAIGQDKIRLAAAPHLSNYLCANQIKQIESF